MSLTYRSILKNKPHCSSQFDDGSWDANVCGCDLLGILHEHLGLPTCPETGKLEGWHRVPYQMDKHMSATTADKIAGTTDEIIMKVLDKANHLWGGTPEEFIKWVRNWQLFLATCGGYIAD
jgi:hypothetical protein